MFQNGQDGKKHRERFTPRKEITKEAEETHGWSKEKLLNKGYKKFSKVASERLVNFLNEHPDLPIVAHKVKFDRDEVLKPAFKKVENDERLPKKERWRCTLAMAKVYGKIPVCFLDECLKHFKIEGRGDDLHDAVTDARLAGELYMALMNQPVKKTRSLGFTIEQ